MPSRRLGRAPTTLGPWPTADHELTDAEIQEHYGHLLGLALHHYGHDPSYVIAMARSGRVIDVKRISWATRQGIETR